MQWLPSLYFAISVICQVRHIQLTAEWHLPSLHFMFVLLAFAVASELSAWKGEANVDVNTEVLEKPLNQTGSITCPKCKVWLWPVPKGCPDVPWCSTRCPACRRGWLSLPPYCSHIPRCPLGWVGSTWKEEENQESNSLPLNRRPGLLWCPPGTRFEPKPMGHCVPVLRSNDGWRSASLDA